ncbi:MAG: lantibiotic dehydratase [Acidobacteriota bacterium]
MLADALHLDATPCRLLAVRRAGAPLDDVWSLRNERFEHLLAEREALRGELESLRQPLIDALYAQVPRQPNRGARRLVLKLKRDIFNGRSPGPVDDRVVLPNGLRSTIERYRSAFEQNCTLLERNRAAVLASSRERLDALLDDQAFRLALSFASPDLAAAAERRPPGGSRAPRFDNLERGLYSYASRFATKANPLHLFASVQLGTSERGAGAGPWGDRPSEPTRLLVYFEPAGLLELERRVLDAGLSDGERTAPSRLALPPRAVHGEQCLLFVAGARGVELRMLPWTEGLRTLLALFDPAEPPTQRRADLEARLDTLDAPSRRAALEALEALESAGGVTHYLLPDLEGAALLWDAAECADLLAEDALAHARRLHFAELDVGGLDAASSALEMLEQTADLHHQVTAFHAADAGFAHRAVDLVAADLAALKPAFLAAGHNFSHYETVLRAFVVEYLEARGGSAPYLEILTRFLVDRRGIIERFQPERHEGVAQSLAAAARWRRSLARLDGVLEVPDLHRLVAKAPSRAETAGARSLCVNGVWDAEAGLFTVSNLFDGAGHFASRFRLGEVSSRAAALDDFETPSEGALEVELAVPPVPSINFVAPSRAAGLGFEARYSHGYSRWIEPADVELALVPGTDGAPRVRYRQRSNGRRLRFVYRGFLLGQLLSAEWQLLRLDGQGDAFHNPFDRVEARGSEPVAVPSIADAAVGPCPGHDRALVHGRVRLRRESWSLDAALLSQAPSSDDPIELAVAVREWLRGLLQRGGEPVGERWYYHALGTADGASKPRYLDLRNPLSVHAFRRILQAVSNDPSATAALRFTAVDPPPQRWHDGRVHELMIEV